VPEPLLGRAGDGPQLAQASGSADAAIIGIHLGQILEQPACQIPVLTTELVQGLSGMCIQGIMDGLYLVVVLEVDGSPVVRPFLR